MIHLDIVYNPYREMSRILVDSRPVSEHGELARYQSEPFYRWCGEIFDVISRQINDQFTLSFTSTMIEREIMTELGKAHPDCRKVEAKPCAVNVPLSSRYDALQKHLGQRGEFFVYLMTPPGKESLRAEAKQFSASAGGGARLMKSPYQSADIKLMLGEPPLSADPDKTLCVFLCDSFSQENAIPSGAFLSGFTPAVLSIALAPGQGTGFSHKQGSLYSYRCEPGKLEKLLLRFLDFCCVAPHFNRSFESVRRDPDFLSAPLGIRALDCVEPVVSVSGPATVEEGRSEKLSVSVYPPNMTPPQLSYRTVPDGIVSCGGSSLQGLSQGAAMVEAYTSGSPEPCSRFQVQVIRRNRITKLMLSSAAVELPVGGEAALTCTWEPADADNASAITWTSSRPSVVRAKAGKIRGEAVGDATVTVAAEGVSASVKVRVKPVVGSITLSASDIKMSIGQRAQLSYQFAPADAYQPKINIKMTDPSVVQYQNGQIFPRCVGETDIVFESATGGARAKCHVKVGASTGEQSSGSGALILAIVLALASFALPSVAGIALAALALVTLFFGVFRQSGRLSPVMLGVAAASALSIVRAILGMLGGGL